MTRREFLGYTSLFLGAALFPAPRLAVGNAPDGPTGSGKDPSDGGKTALGPEESPPDRKYIFLTIDDGPTTVMGDILDLLRMTSCRATFFCIGSLLEAGEGRALALRALAEGHRIGNHSYTFPHPSFPTLTYDRAREEIDKTHQIIGEILKEAGTDYGLHGSYFRFPFGYSGGKRVVAYLHSLGYAIYRWNINSFDWKCERRKATVSWVEKRCIAGRDGDIILCHDHGPSGIACRLIPSIVTSYRARGFDFETLAPYRTIRAAKHLRSKNVIS
jgi:peptidoglycan/xylan/chitin deacetylase (PgdA/CDA1 family)